MKYLPGYPTKVLSAASQAICNSPNHPELKWIAGLFFYMSRVQNSEFPQFNWTSYKSEVKQFVERGMLASDTKYIDGVSGIVNRRVITYPRLSGICV